MALDARKPIETLALSVLESLGGRAPDDRPETLDHTATSRDYYTLLRISPSASEGAIRDAIENLRSGSTTLPFHVRVTLENLELVLLNPELRARYDASLT